MIGELKATSMLCDDHFSAEDFKILNGAQIKLKSEAVPKHWAQIAPTTVHQCAKYNGEEKVISVRRKKPISTHGDKTKSRDTGEYIDRDIKPEEPEVYMDEAKEDGYVTVKTEDEGDYDDLGCAVSTFTENIYDLRTRNDDLMERLREVELKNLELNETLLQMRKESDGDTILDKLGGTPGYE